MKTQPLRRLFRLWTVLLVVVPCLVIMIIYTVGQINEAKQQNLQLISQRVHAQERLIDYWIAERADDVRKLSRLEAFRTLDEQQMKRTLELTQQGDKYFDSLSYIDRDGLFRASTFSVGIRYPLAVGQPYFETARAGSDYISDIVVGRNSGQPIINFSSPVYDYSGNFQGIVLGSVRTTTLQTLLHENWIGQTGEVFLANREGTMLTEPRFVDVLNSKGILQGSAVMKFKITNDAFRNIRLGESGEASWIDYLDNKVLGAYLDVPERGWTLIGKINEAEVLAPIYKQLERMALGTFLLILLILPLVNLITNRIRRPIDWLIGQSKLVETEDYAKVGQDKVPPNVPYEMESLCEAFVNMSHKTEKIIGMLKDKEGHLESKLVDIQNMNQMLQEEIFERKEAEKALQQANHDLISANRRSSEILESISDGFFALDNCWHLTYFNSIAEKFSFRSKEGLIGKCLWEIIPPTEPYYSLYHEAKRKNVAVHFEAMANDNKRWVEVHAYPSQDGLSVYFRDITDRKQTEQKILEAARQLEEGQRLAALGVMATSIAHEINQPLNSIQISSSGMVFAESNRVRLAKADMLKEFALISEQADRIDGIIKNIRMFVKNDYSPRQAVALKGVIDQVIETVTNNPLFRDITIKTFVGNSVPPVMANPIHLQQVLTNLIINAAQSLSQSSQTLKIIKINLWTEDKIILEVCDNGPGLPDEMAQKIFEPFVTLRPDDQAMGLGLSIVQTIVNTYGGVVHAYNNDEGGATISVRFPFITENQSVTVR